jgi:hypothetical protein
LTAAIAKIPPASSDMVTGSGTGTTTQGSPAKAGPLANNAASVAVTDMIAFFIIYPSES